MIDPAPQSRRPSPLWRGFGAIGRHPIAFTLIGLVGVGAATLHLQPPSPSTRPTPPPVDHSVPQAMSPSMAAQFVGPKLKDPDSARYRNVDYRTRHGLPVLCGEVNSRNGFGGYTGFQDFVLMGPLLFVEDGGVRFVRVWNRECAKTDRDDKPAGLHPAKGGRHHGA